MPVNCQQIRASDKITGVQGVVNGVEGTIGGAFRLA